MINNLLIVVCLICSSTHYFIRRNQLSKEETIDLFLLYFLVFGVGIVGLLGFISHIFFAEQTALLIGWPPGSPFQREVGFHDGAWGLLGFLSIYFQNYFWLATGLGWSFFMLGADFVHIKEMILHHNYAPYNAGSIISDTLIPVILLFLLFLKFRKRAANKP